ncbi:MAG: hypothetical protein INF12_14775 [Methylobacterium sp.]|nr:hypothetical protein [Methylobacterium sp.]
MIGRKPWGEKEARALCAMWNAGETADAIAVALNRTKAAVKTQARKLGMGSRRKRSHAMTPAQIRRDAAFVPTFGGR